MTCYTTSKRMSVPFNFYSLALESAYIHEPYFDFEMFFLNNSITLNVIKINPLINLTSFLSFFLFVCLPLFEDEQNFLTRSHTNGHFIIT